MEQTKATGVIVWSKVPFNAKRPDVPAHIMCEYTAAPHMHNAGYKIVFRMLEDQAREAITELSRICDEIERSK